MKDFLETIRETPLVFDGAMGTMIYAEGVFLNTCYDELCLSRPDLVADIHAQYVAAGADVIETNSFGANRVKLQRHGLADKAAEINRKAAQLALAAAGDDDDIAGSVGPCLTVDQLWRPEKAASIGDALREQIVALVEGGVHFIFLETFAHVDELLLAAGVARAAGVPVLASFTVNLQGETAMGRSIESFVSALDACDDVDGIGINCGTGPAHAHTAAERAMALTGKPFVVMPNAGLPREVDGRMLYLTSPDYFTSYAKRYVQLGARGVGGCCGTTPEHIRVAAKAIKALSGVKKHVEVHAYAPEDATVEPVPQREKSRFAARILDGHKVTSIELTPPRTPDLGKMLERAQVCHDAGVDAINIPDGPRASSRLSPMISALAINRDVGIEPILHYCCRDRNLIGMQSDLLGGYAAGLGNFLIVTGDPPKLGNYPNATGVFDVDAVGLTQVVHNLNHGRDLGGNQVEPPTGIYIGVAANPCAVSLEHEIRRYYAKIDAGAEFAITQPIFDADALLRFLDAVETYERTIPVVAGVWPLVSYKNAEFMRNEVPGVVLPDSIMERMAQCRTKEDGVNTGIRIAREMCAAIEDRVAGFQVSAPFGKVDLALRVLGLG